MNYREAKEFDERKTLGCWFCGSMVCNLTHKKDNYSNAVDPERCPYNMNNIIRTVKVLKIVNPDGLIIHSIG